MVANPIGVLVVDDERATRRMIAGTLSTGGYSVLEAETGEDALDLMQTRRPPLMVLDIMLPGVNGFEVCRALRERGQDVGILMLTSMSEASDRVYGLDQGADDYLVKPFYPEELLARIRAIQRRMKPSRTGDEGVEYRGLRLVFRTQKCFRDEREVDLTQTEFVLLAELLRCPGEVRSREELSRSLWGEGHFGSTKALDVYIRRLREKIEDDPSDPVLIQTVRGHGYVCE